MLLSTATCSENDASNTADDAPADTAPYANSNPSWSPDGGKIAFYSDRGGDNEIYIADLETGALRQKTDNDVQDFGPTWSSEGEMLAFYRGDDAFFEIYFMDLRDESVSQITDFAAYTGNPAFSPDGRSIAFSSNKDGRIYEIGVPRVW